MATTIIPIVDADTLGKFYFTTTLSSVDFKIHFHFNDRSGYWYFDLYDATGETLLRAGVKCVVNFPVLRQFVDVRKPDGVLMLLDTRTTTSASVSDPDLTGLGTNAQLAYYEVD